MTKYIVQGGHPLFGEVRISGAKNAAVAIIPATRSEAEIERLLAAAQSAVIMKVGRHLAKVRRVLDRLGRTADALVVERATQDRQRLIPLADLAEAPYFSLILVHS